VVGGVSLGTRHLAIPSPEYVIHSRRLLCCFQSPLSSGLFLLHDRISKSILNVRCCPNKGDVPC
jgi:hypothetical protein